MDSFVFFAQPWWVNVLAIVPVAAFFAFRKGRLSITKRELVLAAIFGIAFGFVEAAVVVYLRAALGFLPGYMGTLSDVIAQSAHGYEQMQAVGKLPESLMTVDFFREAATIVMLVTLAALSKKKLREQCAMFLWVFALWDIFYYVGLWLTTRWPSSLTTPDVLFLIPVPWLSQVWFPCTVSGLTILAVALSVQNSNFSKENPRDAKESSLE